jgi:hypothetical protein
MIAPIDSTLLLLDKFIVDSYILSEISNEIYFKLLRVCSAMLN